DKGGPYGSTVRRDRSAPPHLDGVSDERRRRDARMRPHSLPAVRAGQGHGRGWGAARGGPQSTYGWYWAADLLQELGATVHLAHPLGNNWGNRRVKNDERDATDLVDLLRLGRLAEAWIAPPEVRELRENVRYRARLVALRSGLKSQVHAVLAKEGVAVP